tara:strand:+ start:33 stop:197 length:165 start_codon:yes stop_codon:yes gene_type:complete
VEHKQDLVEKVLLIGKQVQLKQELLQQQLVKVILLILAVESLQLIYQQELLDQL